MENTILNAAVRHGAKAAMLPIERLSDLKKDIEEFSKTSDLNGFQKYIVSSIYQYLPDNIGFYPKSIIVVATPVPSYANVIFNLLGEKITVKSLARYYPGSTNPDFISRQYLTDVLEPMGYHIEPAPKLPLKRLAVVSGLAEYGRNNITYVTGMGSFITLTAYFTDMECEDNWREVKVMDSCSSCKACINNCPTGAIQKDRFLIDNERCLSFFNEAPGEFPGWLPESAHHLIYDCHMCQNICPANRDYLNNFIGPIEFDEIETESLLSGQLISNFPDELAEKIKLLGMDEWIEAIPRNLMVLFENYKLS